MTEEYLCQCTDPVECRFRLVREAGGKSFDLCRTSQKHRSAYFKMEPESRHTRVESPQPHVRGVGDLVAKVTSKVGIKPCGGCKKRQAVLNHYFPASYVPVEPLPFDGPVIHNLIYHIWPNNDDVWKWNVDQILGRWGLFNGKKVIGIAVSKDGDEDAVRSRFPSDTQFIVNQNDSKKGEMVNFISLLESVQSMDTNEVTFYAHGKGTKYDSVSPQHRGVRLWAESMYDCLLDYPEIISRELSYRAMLGLFSMSANFGGFPKRLEHHYSGSFYWFRNAHVYHRNWRYTHNSYYGSEMWPGFMFKSEDISALMPLPKARILRLYSADFWKKSIMPEIKRWKIRNKDFYEPRTSG